MINANDPFEKFIRDILSKHNQADTLREIASRNKISPTTDHIDSFFSEVLIEEFFADDRIETGEKIKSICHKLLFLLSSIRRSTQTEDRFHKGNKYTKKDDIAMIKLCLSKLVNDQYNINEKFIEIMNLMHQHYNK